MATQGVFNGTDVFVRVNDGNQWISLGGQLSHTETLTNSLIDITNKITSPKYRQLLEDEGNQQIDYSVELLFVSQAGYDFVRELAGNKGQALFQTIRTDVPTGAVQTEATLQVQSFADSSSDNESLKGTISLMSSDAFEFNLNATYSALLTSGGDNFITSDGNQFYVRD